MDSKTSIPPPCDLLDALLDIPDDDVTDTEEAPVEKAPNNPISAIDLAAPADVKSVPAPAAEPLVKTEPDTIPESVVLQDSKPPPTISLADAAPLQSSLDDALTSFNVAVKRMAGELKVSILWDRSHKYFPGLRTVVQFNLVG